MKPDIPKPKSGMFEMTQHAEALLTASTRVERLNKLLNHIQGNSAKLSRTELWEREGRIRSEVEKEQWLADISAADLGTHLGTSDGAAIRKFAREIAPNAERRAIAEFQAPTFDAQPRDFRCVRTERLKNEQARRHATTSQLLGKATGRRYDYASIGTTDHHVKLLMLALDRLLREAKSELRDRGIVTAPQPSPINQIDSYKTAATKPNLPSTFLVDFAFLDAIAGVAAITVTGAAEIILSGGAIDSVSALTTPPIMAETALMGGGFVIAAGAQVKGNRSNVRRQASKKLNTAIELMANEVIFNHARPMKNILSRNLNDVPAGDIELALDHYSDLERQTAALILPDEYRPNTADAFTAAANSLYENALASARTIGRGLER